MLSLNILSLHFGRGLVSTFAPMLSVGQYWNSTKPNAPSLFSRTKWSHYIDVLGLLRLMSLRIKLIAPYLVIVPEHKPLHLMAQITRQEHSLKGGERGRHIPYSAFTDDVAVVGCRRLSQITAPPVIRKT